MNVLVASTALLIFCTTLLICMDVLLGLRRMKSLGNIEPLRKRHCPKVTIIVPACNEGDTIRPALTSLLKQDYDNREIIVINDRSTDHTGEVLKQMHLQYDFRQHDISELADGWLGKNHALQSGALLAEGDYLLFTDADIVMEETTLSRAMAYVTEKKIDHLSLLFKSTVSGGLLNALILDAGAGLLFLFKPWKAQDTHNRHFMGVGAFNLVRASAYHDVEGHEKIRTHPIDDIMLGKLLKEHGFRQNCLLGQDYVTVRWYENTGQMIDGLMKNVFSLFHFSLFKALTACFISFALHILPFWALFFTHGVTQILFGLTILIRLASFASGFRTINLSPWNFPWALITPYINIYIVLKASVSTLLNNSITWRGTIYPLTMLRKNEPIL